MEARGEIINASSGPSKEIAGLKKIDDKDDDARIAKFAYVGILA